MIRLFTVIFALILFVPLQLVAKTDIDKVDSDSIVFANSVQGASDSAWFTVNDFMLEDKLVTVSDVYTASDVTMGKHLTKDQRKSLKWKDLDSIQAAIAGYKHNKFVPDSKRATWLALMIPGAGQIYNHKFWKLPIFYGGFLGCAYALSWNGQMYQDYSQAYVDVMDSDPTTNSFRDFISPNVDIESNMDWVKSAIKSRRDRYRRYRDMSIFCFAGVYLLSVIDAYVDAELSHFDITHDLSLEVSPTIFNQERTPNVGFHLALNF